MSDDVVRRQLDRADPSPTKAIVGAVASVLDRDPLDLPPLQHAIDTEAFTALWQTPVGRQGLLYVGFEYAGCHVSVEDGGDIKVEPLSG